MTAGNSGRWLIYGANGYTGRLVAREAVRRGMRPRLAGRRLESIEAVGRELDLETDAFGLDDASRLDSALTDVDAVLHCAGPFAGTAAPMVEACLRTRTDYLDVTGEIEVFASIARRDGVARERRVMLMPGVGFDVVPSDSLAVHVARRCPGAERLQLAFRGLGDVSRGTATTMADNVGRGGAILRDGRLTPVPAAWRTLDVDFGRGPTRCVSIPWGDVFTAHVSTGIPNIVVYMAAPANLRRSLILSRWLGPVLRTGPVRAMLRRAARSGPPGPSDERRARGSSHLWARAQAADGRTAVSRMHGPDGYTATAECALWIVDAVLRGIRTPGFQTPARVYGPDVAIEASRYTREDLEP
jgi:short subunit dehydrogenase-like uncharacterized protein